MRPVQRWLLGCAAALVVVTPAAALMQQRDDAVETAGRLEALARDGQTLEAESGARAYLAGHPRAVPVYVVLGELEFYRHRWPEAMSIFETALQVDPSDEPARKGERDAALALALHHRNSGDPEASLLTLQHVNTVLPRDTKILVSLAVQAQAMRRLDTALQAANAALDVEPANDRALYVAAGIHFEHGESAIAAQQYRSYLKQHPDDASAHFGLGRALRVQQQNEAATAELRQSITLQPVQTEAYFQLGEIALESGRDAEAKDDYSKTLARMPGHGGALTGMGMLAYRAHDYKSAQTYLADAVAHAPDYQPAHYYLGLTLRRLGDTSGSERELHTALELLAMQQGKGSPVVAR